MKTSLAFASAFAGVLFVAGSQITPSAKAATPKATPVQQTPELTISTYESFTSKWGPGPDIQKAFEADCACRIRWILAEDGAALLARLKLEGKRAKADVVVGLDTNLMTEASATGLFADYQSPQAKLAQVPQSESLTKDFTPVDYGWFAFMYDSEKIKAPFASFKDFLASADWKKSVLIEDPRTSTPGLGLMLWLKALYGDKWSEPLKALRAKTLTITKGWSEAYGLFTKGEAPFVLSYTTSEAYHRIEENSTRYRAMNFSEGHYLQIELAGILRTSKQRALAEKFVNFIFDARFQRAVALKNWMYPIVPLAGLQALPNAFTALARPQKSLLIPPAEVATERKKWTREWLDNFR